MRLPFLLLTAFIVSPHCAAADAAAGTDSQRGPPAIAVAALAGLRRRLMMGGPKGSKMGGNGGASGIGRRVADPLLLAPALNPTSVPSRHRSSSTVEVGRGARRALMGGMGMGGGMAMGGSKAPPTPAPADCLDEEAEGLEPASWKAGGGGRRAA